MTERRMEAWDDAKKKSMDRFCFGIHVAVLIGVEGIRLAELFGVHPSTISNCLRYNKNDPTDKMGRLSFIEPTEERMQILARTIGRRMKRNRSLVAKFEGESS